MGRWNLSDPPEQFSELPNTKNATFPRKMLRNHKTLNYDAQFTTEPHQTLGLASWHRYDTWNLPEQFPEFSEEPKLKNFAFPDLTLQNPKTYTTLSARPEVSPDGPASAA